MATRGMYGRCDEKQEKKKMHIYIYIYVDWGGVRGGAEFP